MLKTKMIWATDSGGTEEVSSGADSSNAIQSVTITECVNSGEELTLGSVCAGKIKAKIFAPAGGLELRAGTEISVYRHDGVKNHLVGIYIMEKPTRPTANTVNITGYDFVTKLDKDLTAWLNSLNGWPYKLLDFANMVCTACGLSLSNTQIPNGDYLVQKFTRETVTGRQLMQWVGELSCRFCRINRDNPKQLEFAWYEPSGKRIAASGERYYFQNSLTFEDYATAPVDAVQMRLAESAGGAVWPVVPETYNRYVITGNPLLSGSLQADIVPALNTILAELDGFTYTPCKVSVPANMELRAGHTVTVTDKNGKTFTTCIMTKEQTGQKDTLECTGSYRMDTATANSAQSAAASASAATAAASAAAAAASASAKAAQSAAKDAVNGLTQEQVFNKLTKNGEEQGIYMEDGKIYIHLSYMKAGEMLVESEAFLEPGMEEAERIKRHIQKTEVIPDSELWLYDFNEDGIVDLSDAILVRRSVQGAYAVGDSWSKAKKSTLSVSIKPSDPNKTIRITGTNMWGRKVEVVIGANPQFSVFATKDYVTNAIETALESMQ